MPKLDGKVSLVTGGTSGTSLAAANALAREGSYTFTSAVVGIENSQLPFSKLAAM